MIYDPDLLDRLSALPADPWRGEVFRHMFADYKPDRENRAGARWNPPETPAIYTSLTREVGLAEAEFHISQQPVRPSAKRTIYRIHVTLASVVDLSDRSRLATFGISDDELVSLDHRACQRVGGAIEWLDNDGLLVPSARAAGVNLIIFPNRQKGDYEFRVIDCDVIDEHNAPAGGGR